MGQKERGFSGQPHPRQAAIAQVSGKNGGYYGYLAATKGAREKQDPVRRTLAERIILDAVQERISDPEHIACVLRRVEDEIANLQSDLPDTLVRRRRSGASSSRSA